MHEEWPSRILANRPNDGLELASQMAFIAAVALFAARALLGTLAAVALLALFLLVLPMKARVSGSLRVDGDFDAFLDGDGAMAIASAGRARKAGSLRADDGLEEDAAVILRWNGAISAGVLGGMLSVDYASGEDLSVAVLGIRIPVQSGRGQGSGKEERSTTGKRIPRRDRASAAANEDAVGGAENRRKGTADRLRARKASRRVKWGEAKKWLAPEVRKRALSAATAIVRSLRLWGRVGVECGLPDPSVVGMAYAAFITWSGACGQRWLTFRPNFAEDVISTELSGRTKLIPVQVVWIIGRFLLSRDIRPLWRSRRAAESRATQALRERKAG